MNNNKYTPETIDKSFVIPLYQRLFSWDITEVAQLLNDLYNSFCENDKSPYYIGVLTVYKGASDSKYSLVDGQQRFTVLNLFGIAFGWKEFLKSDEDFRLSFFARKDDQDYLVRKIDGRNQEAVGDYVNEKMEVALKFIENFVASPERNNIDSFKEYVKTKATFFLSELPDSYSVHDLNRYFEAMNEAGKGLENHEILKVQLLRTASEDQKEEYTKIWNVVSEMDRCIIRQKEGELKKDYRERNIKAIVGDSLLLKELKVEINSKDRARISEIKANSKRPEESSFEIGEKAILSFSDFLLQVLWICLQQKERNNATTFFNRFNLLETFDRYLINGESRLSLHTFFKNLLDYRIMFDYFIIRLNNQDNRNTNYSLNMIDSSKGQSSNLDDVKKSLIHYQSMLNVSTLPYNWLTPILERLQENCEISIDELLCSIKIWDNQKQLESSMNTSISLNYPDINRYWFWRLDFYLWEHKERHFSENLIKIANNYIFRSNRSIEHAAPQNPKRESKFRLEGEYLDSFGNLAMISSGQNSSLRNESFEVKRAHVESFINESVGGSIESLKMLSLYKYSTWNVENLKEHHNEMISILIDSFESVSSENLTDFRQIIESLEENKLK